MKSLDTQTLQHQRTNTLLVIRCDTNCKPVLIERLRVTHLIKAYVYIYSLQQSHLKIVNFPKKDIYEINQEALNLSITYTSIISLGNLRINLMSKLH